MERMPWENLNESLTLVCKLCHTIWAILDGYLSVHHPTSPGH